MIIGRIYKQLALISPRVEVLLRLLYWKNVRILKKINPNKTVNNSVCHQNVDFDKILAWLCAQGIISNSLIVCHSSFDVLKSCGLKPNEIISLLRKLIGEGGTLAMPVIRHYREMPSVDNLLTADYSNIICKYDLRKTPVSSGLLPSILMREKDAAISMHPLNPMAAVGPLAKEMMEHNLEGEKPSPHGPNSSWKFCADHNAFIVSIGVNPVHHLTMVHVNDECNEGWPYKDWYHELQFDIVMPDKSVVRKVVRDRKPKWGLIHDAEMNMGRDLYESGIIKTTEIDGVKVSVTKSGELMNFLRNHKHKGYPYYKIFS